MIKKTKEKFRYQKMIINCLEHVNQWLVKVVRETIMEMLVVYRLNKCESQTEKNSFCENYRETCEAERTN